MKQSSISRRQFIASSILGATGVIGGLSSCQRPAGNLSAKDPCQSQSLLLPKPTSGQVRWQDCEVGVIYHFDASVAVGRHESGNNAYRDVFDPQQYNPVKLDTDQWLEAARAAGARYAIFTATHFNGFMQWQSDLYPYGLKQAAWRNGKGDIVGDFVNSCRRVGILPGIYFSTHRNAYWQVWGHYVDWGKGKGTARQAAFNRVAEKMTEELCSRYGDLVQIWYDAGVKAPEDGGPDVLPIFEKYQPDSVFYHSTQRSDHRWIGNEEGYADYPCWATMPNVDERVSHNLTEWRPLLGTGDPEGTVWSPGMVDVPLRGAAGIHNWFWKPGQDHGAHPVNALVDMYYRSVGRNCNLVIGEVVNADGLVPQSDIDRLAAFGNEIKRRFTAPLASTKGKGYEIRLDLRRPSRIDHVIMQEEIECGERIRSYRIDGLAADGIWQPLCEGTAVGHKRIERFDPVTVSVVRMKIDQATVQPLIRQLAVYDTMS